MVALGIDVGGTNLRVGAVNEQGELIHSFRVPTPQSADPNDLIKKIEELYHQVTKELNEPLHGVGLGWPGAVDRVRGVVLETPNISGFKDFPLKEALSKKLKTRVQVENDAKCAGLAEKHFGQAQGFKDFLLLTFGTGIGGVIFANDQLVYGSDGLAGEIGHMLLHPGGRPCSCGDLGCFEKYCSAKSLENLYFERTQKNLSAKELLEQRDSVPEAQIILDSFVKDLSLGIGSLINIFNCEAVIFSGGLFTTGGRWILEQLHISLKLKGFQSLKKNVQLVPSNLEGKAGIIGAAALMLP
jgi:glucokinase